MYLKQLKVDKLFRSQNLRFIYKSWQQQMYMVKSRASNVQSICARDPQSPALVGKAS